MLHSGIYEKTGKFPGRIAAGTPDEISDRDISGEKPSLRKDGKEGAHKGKKSEGGASDSINIYFSSIKKFSLLTYKEERVLARKIAKGDKEARKRMIESNLRLVINIAKRYANRGLPLQDLIEEGNIGLIKSVERFKTTKGCKFSTYATYWIKQAIDRAIANQANTIRLPIHITTDLSKLSRAERELTAELSREPDVRELSEKSGFSGRYVKKLHTINKKSYSLEAAISEESDQSLMDVLVDEKAPSPMDHADSEIRAAKIKAWLEYLDDNERTIIKLRFGLDNEEPQTLETVGKKFGITRERVRQIEAKALGKLKTLVEESKLEFTDIV